MKYSHLIPILPSVTEDSVVEDGVVDLDAYAAGVAKRFRQDVQQAGKCIIKLLISNQNGRSPCCSKSLTLNSAKLACKIKR